MYELVVARKHITSSPRNVLFAVLAVALAVAVIVIMMGLMEGYREEIISNTVENSPHLTIGPKEDEDYIILYRTLSATVGSYPGVVAVSPRLLAQAGAEHRDEVEPVSFIGADPILENRMMRVQEDVVVGDYLDLVTKRRSAIVGTRLAENLDVKVGESLTIIRQNRSVSVEVVGMIEKGTAEDETLIYLPLETAQDLLGEGDVVSQIGVRLSDIDAAPALAAAIDENTSYDAKSWQEQSSNILDLLDTQDVILFIFYFIVIVVAGFGVANTMIMTVTRRTKEIGILMAMGSTRRSILKVFLVESIILGPPSALLGIALAYVTAKAIEAYPIEIPSEFNEGVSQMVITLTPEIIAWGVAIPLFINLVAGLYPAFRASRLDPVKAIGSE